jgi:hypothetical protein
MSSEIRLHDIVALLEDTVASHFETGRSIVLRRGQIGTIVMPYPSGAFEVEFSGPDGRAYAILPVQGDRLMVLKDSPEYAQA